MGSQFMVKNMKKWLTGIQLIGSSGNIVKNQRRDERAQTHNQSEKIKGFDSAMHVES